MSGAAEVPWAKEQSVGCPWPSLRASELATDGLASDAPRELAVNPMGLGVMPRRSVLWVEREDKEDRPDKAGDGGQDMTSSSSSRRAS